MNVCTTYNPRHSRLAEQFIPLENAITNKLLPSIFGRQLSNLERRIVALPVRFGGMGIQNPSVTASREYEWSKKITEPLVDLIYNQEMRVNNLDHDRINNMKENHKTTKEMELEREFQEISSLCHERTKRALVEAHEKGASS